MTQSGQNLREAVNRTLEKMGLGQPANRAKDEAECADEENRNRVKCNEVAGRSVFGRLDDTLQHIEKAGRLAEILRQDLVGDATHTDRIKRDLAADYMATIRFILRYVDMCKEDIQSIKRLIHGEHYE